MSTILLDVVLGLPPFVVGIALTWEVIWPRWKVYGKGAFYVAAVAILSVLLGHWSILIGWLHQSIGLVFHVWFCKRHGFTWYAVEDPERYVALTRGWVAGKEASPRSNRL